MKLPFAGSIAALPYQEFAAADVCGGRRLLGQAFAAAGVCWGRSLLGQEGVHFLATFAGAGLAIADLTVELQPRVARHRHNEDDGIGGREQACVLHDHSGPDLVWLRRMGFLRRIERITAPIDRNALSSRQAPHPDRSTARRWSRPQGLRCGPVIKEDLRIWFRRDVLSQGPALGANAVSQRIHLARVA
jgi:hypothetical protein